jgi:hypothetical protein
MSTLLKLKRPIREATVQASDDDSFVVRGLNPIQVFALYRRHTGQFGDLFKQAMASEASQADIYDVATKLAADAPTLLAELIVVASGGSPDIVDEFDDAYAVAAALPFPVQADALAKIGDLTFTSEMPPGKFLALVVKMAKAATGAIGQQASTSGSGASGAV